MTASATHLRAARQAILRSQYEANQTGDLEHSDAILRAWTYLAAEANRTERALVALPGSGPTSQVAMATETMRRAHASAAWAGSGAIDASMRSAVERLRAAQRLGAVPTAETDTARTELASILWLGAHHAGTSARRRATAINPDSDSAEREALHDVADRLSTMEALAAGVAHSPPPTTWTRSLINATAGWDLLVHRELMVAPTFNALRITAEQQMDLASATAAAFGRSRAAGALSQDDGGRVLSTLEQTRRHWFRLEKAASVASPLDPPETTDALVRLVDRAQLLRERLVTQRLPANASAEAHRAQITAVGGCVLSAASVGTAVMDAIERMQQNVDARTLSRVLAEHGPEQVGSLVNPVDIRRKALVPIPDELRGMLARPARDVAGATRAAARASAVLDASYRASSSPPSTVSGSQWRKLPRGIRPSRSVAPGPPR